MSALTDTYWFTTLHLNIARAVSATVTLVFLYLIGCLIGAFSVAEILGVFVIPLGLLCVGVAAILVFRAAGAVGVPFMKPIEGLLALMMIVFIAIGDPLLWLLRRWYPNIVPVHRFRILNFRAVILVQEDELATR